MISKYRKLYWFFFFLSILLNVAPLAGYTIKAMVESNLTHEKVALCFTVFIVLIMTAVCMMRRLVLKSRLWILLIGLYVCLDYILTPLMIIAICQVVDELVVVPLRNKYGRYLEDAKVSTKVFDLKMAAAGGDK